MEVFGSGKSLAARASRLTCGTFVWRQAYDQAAICARGVKEAKLNFPLADYAADLDRLRATPLEQLAASLRCAPGQVQGVETVGLAIIKRCARPLTALHGHG